MGGNVGGSFSSGAFEDLEKRIMERLRTLVRSANKVVFACERDDQRALLSHMSRSGLAVDEKISLAIGPDLAPFVSIIDSAQLVVTFSNEATRFEFLDSVTETAFAQQTQCIHVRAHLGAAIPSKILAYRFRVMSWDELMTLIR